MRQHFSVAVCSGSNSVDQAVLELTDLSLPPLCCFSFWKEGVFPWTEGTSSTTGTDTVHDCHPLQPKKFSMII